jgi:hypothetical protein
VVLLGGHLERCDQCGHERNAETLHTIAADPKHLGAGDCFVRNNGVALPPSAARSFRRIIQFE